MKQFDLSLWLKDKSRKVVTRDGKEVEILKTNRKDGIHPIIFTILDQNGVEQVHFCNKVGICTTLPSPNKFDLFFADEGDELTEFEKRFIELIRLWRLGNTNPEENLTQSRFDAKELLNLARKEILKDLPKWKKITEEKQNYLAYGYLSHDGYYLSIQELKDKLPKEE